MHESKSFNKHPANKTLYHALMESLIPDGNDMDQGVVDLIKHKKRPHDDDDRDQDPFTGPDQGLNKRKTSKDAEPPKKPKSTGSSKDTTCSQSKSTALTASTTKTKAAKYDAEALKTWHDVYSTMRILSVTSVTVDEWYGYGHLKEIIVKRADQKLYKFMKGDFLRLHLNDIKDIVPYTTFLETQGVIYEDKLKRKRLLRTEELYKFSDGTLTLVRNTLDQMLKNLRLGYNKAMERRKWTATDQKQTRIMIKDINQQLLHKRIMRSLEKFVVPYTTFLEPQGVIYKDKLKRKRLLRTEELYKFSDGTLTLVRNTLDQMLKNLRLGYNKAMEMRKWTTTDQKRTCIMIKDINQQLLHKRIMRSLEKFVGGRDYGTNYRLLQRILVGNAPKFTRELLGVDDKLVALCSFEITYLITLYSVSYKVVKYRYLPRDISLIRIKVLRYDTKGVNARKEIMQTKTELTLEQTQQGVSDKVLISIEEVFPMVVAAASPRRVRFIATCSYPTDICKDIMKAQVHVSKDFRYSARLP
ncbi:hypothetical protein Tco_0343727 [Tanacetum coccineum]